MIRILKNKIKKHRRDLNRYLKEVKEAQKGRLTKSKASQMSYSYQKANEELAICDVLEELLTEVEKDGKR